MPVTELKKKMTKLGVVITSMDATIGDDYVEQAKAASLLTKESGTVLVHGPEGSMSPENPYIPGLQYVTSKQKIPALKFAVSDYIGRIRASHSVGFCRPKVQFDENFEALWDFVVANRMERTWAFYIKEEGSDIPIFIGMSGPLIEHIFHSAPDGLLMQGEEWMKWLHEWASKAVMRHRYFDASGFLKIRSIKAKKRKSK